MADTMLSRIANAIEAEINRQSQAPGYGTPYIGHRTGDEVVVDGEINLKDIAVAVVQELYQPDSAMKGAMSLADSDNFRASDTWEHVLDAVLKGDESQ